MKKIFRILIVIITIIHIPQTIYTQESGSGQKKVNKYGIFEYAGIYSNNQHRNFYVIDGIKYKSSLSINIYKGCFQKNPKGPGLEIKKQFAIFALSG
jgi:hypothetical protein